MAKKRKFKGHKVPKQQLRKNVIIQRIVDYFNANPIEPVNYKQVSAGIGATLQADRLMVAEVLDLLHLEEFLVDAGHGKYRLKNVGSVMEGTFERRHNGKNSFIPDGGGTPIFVAERNSLYAMNKDRVKVQILAMRKGRDPEAVVLEILQRVTDTVVGVLEVSQYYAYLIVDSKTFSNDIFIPRDKLKNGKSGDKAVVKITEWPEKAKNPVGEVIDVLGSVGNNQAEMHAILVEFGLPYKYPDAVEKAARKIPSKITKEDVAEREDFRQTPTFTIDPKDAKDYDDALSLKQLPNGNWEIGVHIADVSHYVKPGSIIDKEASERATSVYLVDRVVPMLPEKLSNELCSLRPHEDKLCFSAVFELDNDARVKNYRIVRTVIHSDRRMDYDEAQAIIERNHPENDSDKMVLELHRLAQILRTRRYANGAINFERAEVKFEIDENGKPLSVYFKEAKESNQLIEEFMLIANKTVAEAIGKVAKGKKAKTFVYRVHDVPNPDKLTTFAQFIRRFGYKLKDKGEARDISRSINNLLNAVQGKKEQNLIEIVAIRSMAKAVYTTINIGHYGLGYPYYTHFTSPIRRYPDLMVHRLLERYLAGGRSVSEEKLEEDCKHCSEMEALAAQAERTSIKYKQVEFMSDKIGQVFDGVISGVTEWGLYVEINENHCEGMIPMRDLTDDYYEFDEKTYSLIGHGSKRRFSLGDPLRIRVVRANLEKKQLDFTME